MWGENWGEMIWGNPSTIIPVAIPIDGIWLFILGIILGATAIIARRNNLARLASFSLILLVPVVAVFAVNLPHTFTNGTIADADEVNANFEALANAASEEPYKFSTTTERLATQTVVALDINRMKDLCADLDGCDVRLCRQGGPANATQCNSAHFSMAGTNSGYRINDNNRSDGNFTRTLILQARELDQREILLKAAESRIDEKVAELEALRQSIEGLLAQHDEETEAQMKSLVKIYEAMKPKDAARIFEQLDMVVLLEVIERMKERKTAPILANMDPERAKTITLELAQRRTLPLAKE